MGVASVELSCLIHHEGIRSGIQKYSVSKRVHACSGMRRGNLEFRLLAPKVLIGPLDEGTPMSSRTNKPETIEKPTIQTSSAAPQKENDLYLTAEEIQAALERMKGAGDQRLSEWAQGLLTAESSTPLDQLISRQLLASNHAVDCAQALRELQGRFFFLSHHLHQHWVSMEQAIRTAEEAVASVAWHAWRAGGNRRCSWLHESAVGHRPLAILLPETDSEGRFHVHGFVHLPPTLQATCEQLRTWMGRIPPGRSRTPATRLHHDATHLVELHHWELLRPYALYATKQWAAGSPAERRIVPAPYGASLIADWTPVTVRMDQLQAERSKLRRLTEHQTALQTQALLDEGARQRREAAKKASKRRKKPIKRKIGARTASPAPNYRSIAVIRKPDREPKLPREGGRTGPVEW